VSREVGKKRKEEEWVLPQFACTLRKKEKGTEGRLSLRGKGKGRRGKKVFPRWNEKKKRGKKGELEGEEKERGQHLTGLTHRTSVRKEGKKGKGSDGTCCRQLKKKEKKKRGGEGKLHHV